MLGFPPEDGPQFRGFVEDLLEGINLPPEDRITRMERLFNFKAAVNGVGGEENFMVADLRKVHFGMKWVMPCHSQSRVVAVEYVESQLFINAEFGFENATVAKKEIPCLEAEPHLDLQNLGSFVRMRTKLDRNETAFLLGQIVDVASPFGKTTKQAEQEAIANRRATRDQLKDPADAGADAVPEEQGDRKGRGEAARPRAKRLPLEVGVRRPGRRVDARERLALPSSGDVGRASDVGARLVGQERVGAHRRGAPRGSGS